MRGQPLLEVGFGLWIFGVLCLEGVASAGMASVFAGVLFFARGELKRRLRPWWPVFGFALYAVLVPLMGGRLPTGAGVARMLDWVALPFAALALSTLPPDSRERLAKFAAGVFLLSCGVAGLQHFGLWPPEEAFSALAWTKLPFHRVYEPAPGAPGRFMGGGLVFHRLKFAHVGGFLVLGAAVLGLRLRGRRRALAVAVAVSGFVSLAVFPLARAALGALVLSLGAAAFVATRNRRLAFGLSGALLGAAALALALHPSLRSRFVNSLSAEGSGDRARILEAGVAAVAAHPFVGVGLGRFQLSAFAAEGAPQHVLDNTGKAHNQFLSMAAEVGVVGGLAFLALLVLLARRMNLTSAYGAYGCAALLYFVLLSQTHDPLYQAPFSMALVLAIAAGTLSLEQRDAAGAPGSASEEAIQPG